ncbi:MAG: hypothetical protein OXH32_13375 [Acidobacteria bacterium]|nr:hypothetical protein [Acidobacteriota bacterium]MCY3965623.1 hypothetical protein [Acidobacteriota bacterium]
MIRAEERNDITPLCPHCEHPVSVYFREISGILGKRYLYFCALCKKVLGVSHRKGFFMG